MLSLPESVKEIQTSVSDDTASFTCCICEELTTIGPVQGQRVLHDELTRLVLELYGDPPVCTCCMQQLD